MFGCEEVRGVEGGTSDCVAESLGLGLRSWGCGERSLGFGRRCGIGEEVDLLRNGAAEIVEGLADVGWVVVCLVGVLRALQNVRRDEIA